MAKGIAKKKKTAGGNRVRAGWTSVLAKPGVLGAVAVLVAIIIVLFFLWQNYGEDKFTAKAFATPVLSTLRVDRTAVAQGGSMTFSGSGYSSGVRRLRMLCEIQSISTVL